MHKTGKFRQCTVSSDVYRSDGRDIQFASHNFLFLFRQSEKRKIL